MVQRMSGSYGNTDIFWHVLFALYAFFVHAWVVSLVGSVMYDAVAQPLLAFILLVLLFAEPWFFVPRCRAVFARLQKDEKYDGRLPGMWLVLLGIGRLIVTTMLCLLVVQSWTGVFEGNIWPSLLLVANVIKDVVVFFGIPYEKLAGQLEQKPLFVGKSFFVDVFLWLFAAVLYSILWEGIMAAGMYRVSFFDPEAWPQLAGAAILFVLLYLPLRATVFLELFAAPLTFKRAMFLCISLFLTLAAGLSPMLL